MLDEAKLNQFMGQMLADLGGAGSIAIVRMGDNLGLYKTLHAKVRGGGGMRQRIIVISRSPPELRTAGAG